MAHNPSFNLVHVLIFRMMLGDHVGKFGRWLEARKRLVEKANLPNNPKIVNDIALKLLLDSDSPLQGSYMDNVPCPFS